MSEVGIRRPSLTSRIAHALLPSRSRKQSVEADQSSLSPSLTRYKTESLQQPHVNTRDNDYRCEQTGERRDDTDLLHALSRYESFDSYDNFEIKPEREDRRPPGEYDIAKLSHALWMIITDYLPISDVICLAISSKTLRSRIDMKYWRYLRRYENREEKLRFLVNLDEKLPEFLLCFSCATYHRRRKIGNENLKSTRVLNPLYDCDGFRKYGLQEPKMRLTPEHFLPFTFVQLVTRAQKFTPRHGIPLTNLCRRYKDRNSDWFHQTRSYIHKGHLLLRVVSWTFATPGLPVSGKRHLLYSRDDYWPYFSCCAHWRDGELLDVCKCALSHVVEPPSTHQNGPKNIMQRRQSSGLIGALCSFCGPMRRCPNCPTEYMIELKLSEDKTDPLTRFKQSIVVTRWSDLGDGSSPSSIEWMANNNETNYDSFANLGNRAISGIFEAQFGVTLPGQRLISTNPKNQKRGEEGDKWY